MAAGTDGEMLSGFRLLTTASRIAIMAIAQSRGERRRRVRMAAQLYGMLLRLLAAFLIVVLIARRNVRRACR